MEVNSRNGWTFENRDEAIVLANQVLQKPFWREIVEKALTAKEDKNFYPAARAAELLGIDTWNLFWKRLNKKPLEGSRWFFVMKKVNNERIDKIVALAESVLPLEQVATGPSNEMGLGPQYQVHQCLDFIVQDLKQFPEKGWGLIVTSLKSPVIRNRNMALNALDAWGMDHWPEGTKQLLLAASQLEPEQKIKDRIEQLLREGKIED
jgi:hypothetical protein